MQLTLPRLRCFARNLRRETGGLALIEFAFSMPIVFGIGMYGVEVANLAQTNMRVSQIALALADNASRVGVTTNLSTQQLREVDLNDVLQAVRLQPGGKTLLQNGRITLSSLEVNKDGGQWVHWQRCIGLKKGTGWDSSFGKTDDGKLGTAFLGMGPVGSKVTAPPNSAVMFVEVNYDYQPVMGSFVLGTRKVQYTASFIVRDKRVLDQVAPYDAPKSGGQPEGGVYNPAPAAVPSTCNKWTT